MTVLVTGSTGNVGRTVVEALTVAGIEVRAAGRDPERVADLHPQVDTVRLDLTDPATFLPALAGATGLFLIRPPQIARVGSTLNTLLDMAAATRAPHVVFASVAGAERNRLVPHHRIETHLRASGLPWTILRPGFFAQNLGDAYLTDIRDDDRLYVPAGDGRVAFLDVRNIGDIAAHVFATPEQQHGCAYTLTGPVAVSFTEVAGMLTRVLGRAVTYEPATALGYARHLHADGATPLRIAVQLALHLGLRRGSAAQVTSAVPDLTGRAARPLDTYIADHRHLWTRNDR